MRKITLLLIVVLISVLSSKPIPFKMCTNSPPTEPHVVKLEVFPDVIRPGTDYIGIFHFILLILAKITFNNTWTQSVTSGTSVTLARYLGIVVGTYRSELCE